MEFYTYLWLREDGTPYYVGKGSGKRAFISSGHVVRRPQKERIVIYPALSEEEAFETEAVLIWYYGRKDLGTGCLRNLTDGGEGGIAGIKISEQSKDKKKKSLTGQRRSIATRKIMSEVRKGIKYSEETLRRMSEGHKGTNLGNTNAAGPRSAETRTKQSKALKGKPWSDARRAAQTLEVSMRMSLLAKHRNPIEDRHTSRKRSEDYKRRHREAQQKARDNARRLRNA
jgi:hypothetical protein